MASESVLVESSVLVVGVKVPDQVMLSVLVIVESDPLATVMSAELENEITASEKTSCTVAVSLILSSVSFIVKEFTEGAVMSMVKLSTERLSLVKPLLLEVTLILQFVWGPSLKVLKVIVLLSAEDELSELLQSPL